MLKTFPNEGVVGPDYSMLEVESGPSGGVIFTPFVGRIGADAVNEAAQNGGIKPGDKMPTVLLQAKSVEALIALLKSAAPEPVQVATDLVDGKEALETRRYGLFITHDEIHLLHWALKTAESIARRDPMFISNGMTYAAMRQDTVLDEAFEAFVDKFDNVHRQARIDDGEESGVKSNADATPPAAPSE